MGQAVSDSSETRQLLNAIRDGDHGRLGTLLSRHRAYLRQVVGLRMEKKLSARMDQSDVVQETEFEACRRINEYLNSSRLPFRLWLRRIAHDQLIDARRRHIQTQRRSVDREVRLPDRSSAEIARQLVGSSSTPSRQAARRELAEKVRRAMSQLSELDREIVLMYIGEKLTSREVGQVVGMDAAAVRKRYGRALLLLKNSLAREQMDGS